jgi:hypothetical protein
MGNVLIVVALSTITSFIGSFLCFVLWVHFDLDARYEARKYERHAAHMRRAENARRSQHGLHDDQRTMPSPSPLPHVGPGGLRDMYERKHSGWNS